ncbi:hypothetical protein [Parashewanella tropica]|uniref:hypothetical protein n=1 Tax=Parashewanella tropica TaxID=2547970 RepID=UPI001059EB8D|nr:hypothetical protein [Parashewanella tropica]
MKLIGILILTVASFFAGSFWQKWSFHEHDVVTLTEALELQASPTNIGTLPAGTTLYPYSYKGEVATFVVFINTKQLNKLKPQKFKHNFTVAPISAY